MSNVTDADLDDLAGGAPLTLDPRDVEYSVFEGDDDDLGLTTDLDPVTGRKRVPQPVDNSGVTDYMRQDLQFRRQQQQDQQLQQRQQQQQEADRIRNDAKTARLKEIDDSITALIPRVDPLNLPANVMEAYSAETRQVISHAAREQAAEMMRSMSEPLRQVMRQNYEYGQQLEELRTATRPDPQTQVNDRLRAMVPDIENVMGDPGWEAYRRTVIPGTDITVGEIVANAYTQGNVSRIKQYVDQYRSAGSTRRHETPAPAPRNTGGPAVRGQQKQILRFSELEQAYNKHQQGLIDKAKLDRIVVLFENAAAEQRVNYDK